MTRHDLRTRYVKLHRNVYDYANDIERLEFLAGMGWSIVRVSARQLRFERARIVDRVRRALAT